jgi:hypothetical protein
MKLVDYIKLSGISARQFALSVGVTPQAMSRYLADDRVPRKGVMQRIVDMTKGAVQPNDFYSAPVPPSGGATPQAGSSAIAPPGAFSSKEPSHG